MEPINKPPDFKKFGPMYAGFGQAVARWVQTLPPGRHSYIDPFDGVIDVSVEPELIESSFESDLTSLINRHSVENASNTPDFILAQYVKACLAAIAVTIQQRETWYGRDPRPSYEEPKRLDDYSEEPVT